MNTEELRNWFKKKIDNPAFIAGGRYKEYNGLDYGKIAFIISIIASITLTIIVLIAITQ